jgi:SAM-dependent methyltransferase
MVSNTYASGDAFLDNIRLWDELALRIKSSFSLNELGLLRHFQATDHLLDYGCGTGRAISFLYEHGVRDVTGCDTSFRMCEASRVSNPQNRIFWPENPNHRLPADTFDDVTLVGVLSSLVPDKERRRLVDRLASHLRKGGKSLWAILAAHKVRRILNDTRLPSLSRGHLRQRTGFGFIILNLRN